MPCYVYIVEILLLMTKIHSAIFLPSVSHCTTGDRKNKSYPCEKLLKIHNPKSILYIPGVCEKARIGTSLADTGHTLWRFPRKFSRRCVFLEVFRKLSIESEKISRNFRSSLLWEIPAFLIYRLGVGIHPQERKRFYVRWKRAQKEIIPVFSAGTALRQPTASCGAAGLHAFPSV